MNNIIHYFLILMLVSSKIKCEFPELLESWENYKQVFNKQYAVRSQEVKRREAFEDNIRRIKLHNKQFMEGKYSFKMAPNDYADMPNQLYLKTLVRLTPSEKSFIPSFDEHIVGAAFLGNHNEVPVELDWRQEGFVTPACNQKSCGSCYAYSVAHSVSGQIFKRTGKLVMLSEQQIVDCSAKMGNHGCAGGSLRNSLKYLEISGGLMREQEYPYTASQNACKFVPYLAVVNITSWAILPPQDENTLKTAVATIGPIAVSINASPSSFQLYSDGIYDDRECSSSVVNHAMLAVGYTKDYWILKNWWGTRWGENGYMKIKKGINLCGISNFAAYAIV